MRNVAVAARTRRGLQGDAHAFARGIGDQRRHHLTEEPQVGVDHVARVVGAHGRQAVEVHARAGAAVDHRHIDAQQGTGVDGLA